MLFFFLIQALTLNCRCFQFDQGIVELWYTIPVEDIFSIDKLDKSKTTVIEQYSYRLTVRTRNGDDSTVYTGVKYVKVDTKKENDQIMDYLLIMLYPGPFTYQLDVSAPGETITKSGEIEVSSDSVLFFCSDLILSKKIRELPYFARYEVELIPLIEPEFMQDETLFIYFEIYGMVPDSLFYTARYTIVDNANNVVFSKDLKRFKHDLRQIDTLSVALSDLSQGTYAVNVSVNDPALNETVNRECSMNVKEVGIDIDAMPFAYEIEIFLSDAEYHNFLALNNNDKRKYIKKFWSRMNYQQFEKRFLIAEEKFSTSNLPGHKTNLGRHFILNGPPDEIEYRPMETTGMPAQVWHYDAQGLSILWVDNNGDCNYEMMGNLDFQEDFIRDIPINWIRE